MRTGWVLIAAAAGCAKAEDTSLPEVVSACYAYCDVAASGQDCDTEAVSTACRDECELVLLGMPASCEPDYQALVACLEGVTWVCDGSAVRDDLVWPVPEAEGACVEETETLQACSEA